MGKIRGYLNLKPHKDASEQATNYVTDIGSNGIFVHPEGEGPDDTQTPTGWKIADAIELFRSGVSYIKAWIDNNVPKIRVGKEDGGHVEIQSSGMDVYGGDGTKNLAHIGYSETGNYPFFTFGDRGVGTEGDYSFVEGNGSLCSGSYSHAEGLANDVSGSYAHSEGVANSVSGNYAHAEGEANEAGGRHSHVEGKSNSASGDYQHVQGTFNVEDTNGDYADIIGGGTDLQNRKNIEATTWTGDKRMKGDVYVGCNDDSTGGAKVLSEAKIDTGEHSFSNLAANTATSIAVTFSKTFATAPQVVAGLKSSLTSANTGNVAVSASNVSTTGFTLRCYNGSTAQKTIYVSWIAVSI